MSNGITTLSTAKHLTPYIAIAEATALASPCLRRRYGAVIVDGGSEIGYTAESNSKVGWCCGGQYCARTRLGLYNGERTEVGAEIHAEIAALIRHGYKRSENTFFILVGRDSGGNRLVGAQRLPCHSCALALRFAGFIYIYVEDQEGLLEPYSVSQIIREREEEWEID